MAESRFLRALWDEQAALGLNDKDLAGRIGVHKSTISLLKSGARAPGARFIRAVLGEFPALVGYLIPSKAEGRPVAGDGREVTPGAPATGPPRVPSTAR